MDVDGRGRQKHRCSRRGVLGEGRGKVDMDGLARTLNHDLATHSHDERGWQEHSVHLHLLVLLWILDWWTVAVLIWGHIARISDSFSIATFPRLDIAVRHSIVVVGYSNPSRMAGD